MGLGLRAGLYDLSLFSRISYSSHNNLVNDLLRCVKKSIQYHESIYYYMQHKYNFCIALLDVNKATPHPPFFCLTHRNLTRFVCRN